MPILYQYIDTKYHYCIQLNEILGILRTKGLVLAARRQPFCRQLRSDSDWLQSLLERFSNHVIYKCRQTANMLPCEWVFVNEHNLRGNKTTQLVPFWLYSYRTGGLLSTNVIMKCKFLLNVNSCLCIPQQIYDFRWFITVNWCIVRNRLDVVANLTPFNCSILWHNLQEDLVTVLMCLTISFCTEQKKLRYVR